MTILANPTYNPGALLDFAIEKLSLKSDAAFADALDVFPSFLSRIRNKRIPIGPSVLLKIHEMTDLHVRELRKIAGMS